MKKLVLTGSLLLTALLQQAVAQDRSVSGRVIDRATNEGLPPSRLASRSRTCLYAVSYHVLPILFCTQHSFSFSCPASSQRRLTTFKNFTKPYQTQNKGLAKLTAFPLCQSLEIRLDWLKGFNLNPIRVLV